MSLNLPSATLTPDNPFYFLDRTFEPFELWISEVFGGQAGRAEKDLEIAGERIAEIKLMIEKGKPEYVPELTENYQHHMDEALKIAEKINSTDLYELVSNMTLMHQQVLDEVYEKCPEEAKTAIMHAKDVSVRGHEEAQEALGRRNG